MYASNEDEDWVYLHETPPVNIVRSNSSLSSSSITSCSSKSNRTASLSSISSIDHRRIGTNAQQTNLGNSEIYQSSYISQSIEQYHNKTNTLISCTCIILLLTVSFILGQSVKQWDHSTMNKIVKELDKTNQRLNELQEIPYKNIEEKLNKQLEEKLYSMINQQLFWHDDEKHKFIKQVHELQQVLNMTNTIDQLMNDNKRLRDQIKSLQHRLGIIKENDSKMCLEGVNCTISSTPTLNKLASNIFKQTISIATNTSISLSGLFEHLSASVSNLVDHRHKYINNSRRKLTDFTCGSSTAKKIQTSLYRSAEKLSSSFLKAKVTYATWLKSHTQYREQMHYQVPNKQYTCHSKLNCSMNKIRSIKNWMIKFLRL
ncbi:unnamed protein product [Adineta steineri]|uniref:Uncharacterized protein n=2 Tax=Adineta steineri TaxID=433720 RepID=A0A819G0H2_9BILA|nr:unnamed protein product [Adineta steineri]CAF3874209.1 unnamed protein product [Adineta steineri]